MTLHGTVPELGKISKNLLTAKLVVAIRAVVVEMWYRVVVVTVQWWLWYRRLVAATDGLW